MRIACCKYKFKFSLLLGGALCLFVLWLSSCRPNIYYTPEYLQGLQLQKEIDSFNKATQVEKTQKAKEAIKKEKQRVADSLKKAKLDAKINLKKQKEAEQKKKKNQKVEVAKDTTTKSIPKQDSTSSKAETKSDSIKAPSVNKDVPPPPVNKKEKKEKKFVVSKDAIESTVTQTAQSSAIFERDGSIKLVGSTSEFKDMNLSSDTLLYSYGDKQMIAIPKKDSNTLNTIDFRQGKKLFRMESMMYNPTNKKAIFDNVHTKEGELYMHTTEVRQVNDSVFYGKNGIFSTCNYYPPHFSFFTNKYKLVKGRTIVTGALYANFEGVPIPPKIFLLPFAVLPMPKDRNSGVIIPEIQPYGINGFSLSNGGYYFVVSPYLDLKVLGTYSSLGIYSISLASNFIKKYLYDGNVGFDFQLEQRTIDQSELGYKNGINYKIKTRFNLNRNVNPTITFNANIDFVSDARYNVLANNLSLKDRINNSFNTNVSFSKQFRRGVIQNFSTKMSISQNTNNNSMDVSFPDFQLSTRPINPIYSIFGGQNLGTKWYDKLRLEYSLSFINKGSIQIDNFNIGKFFDVSTWSATQSFPLTLVLPKVGPIVPTPKITYSQNLVDRRTYYKWNSETQTIDTIKEQRGIFPRHNLSLGMDFSFEDLIATLQFGPKSRLRALRHIIRFTTGFSYTPDIKEYEFFTFQKNASGETSKLNYFDGTAYRRQESGSISFNMTNVIQAKWLKKSKSNSDTANKKKEEEKKIDLINFSISGSYDLIADSFRWTNINMNYTTRISDKLTFSGNLVFDPYVYDKGRKTPRLLIENLFGSKNSNVPYSTLDAGLATLTAASLSFSYGFKGGDKKATTPTTPSASMGESYTGERYDIMNQTRDIVLRNASQYVDFSIPWSVNIGMSTNYSRGTYDVTKQAFSNNITASLNLSGDVKLTEKWKLGATGMYDVVKAELTTLSLNLSRDLHCWQLTITIAPVGPIKSFGFLVQPRSSILQDLKINQQRTFF